MAQGHYETHVCIRELKSLLREITTAWGQTDMQFPEMFDDYEQYHKVVSTGKLERDGLIAEQLTKNKNARVSGLDISNTACEKARKKGIEVMLRDVNNGLIAYV